MTTTFDQLREARTALDTPLFAGLPGDIRVSFEFFPPRTDPLMLPILKATRIRPARRPISTT